MSKYEDIILNSPPELRHPRMPRQDRAKLFAPFAALSGHGQAVHDREQMFCTRISMTEYTREQLDETLRSLQKGDTVTAVYFEPIQKRHGEAVGVYRSCSGVVLRVAPEEGMLYLKEKSIPLEDLLEIRRSSS